jgi:hypothetical protein
MKHVHGSAYLGEITEMTVRFTVSFFGSNLNCFNEAYQVKASHSENVVEDMNRFLSDLSEVKLSNKPYHHHCVRLS